MHFPVDDVKYTQRDMYFDIVYTSIDNPKSLLIGSEDKYKPFVMLNSRLNTIHFSSALVYILLLGKYIYIYPTRSDNSRAENHRRALDDAGHPRNYGYMMFRVVEN